MPELSLIINNSLKFLQKSGVESADFAVVLGSGMGSLVEILEEPDFIPYERIPGFASPSVPGHTGRLYIGKIQGFSVIMMQGRYHLYEGRSPEEITFPIRLLSALKVKKLLLTNAAGSLNPEIPTGSLLLIDDHINLTGANPLIGYSGPLDRFVDMSHAYDPDMNRTFKKVAEELNISLAQGVYLAVSGPNYETPAEIRAFQNLGASAVGMSTVHEVIIARQEAVRVSAISCISNPAAGLEAKKLNHQDVIATTRNLTGDLSRLIQKSISDLLN